MSRTKVYINLINLRKNISAIKKQMGPEKKICLPLEADAYNHGALEVAKAGLEAGVDYFAVKKVSQGKILRDNSMEAPIILLSQPKEYDHALAIEAGLTLILSEMDDIKSAEFLAQLNGTETPIHLMIDTEVEKSQALAKAKEGALYIKNSSYLRLEGFTTSLGPCEAERRIESFLGVVESLRLSGIDPEFVHVSDLEDIPLNEDYPFNMVHLGLAPYGYPLGKLLPQNVTMQRVLEIVAPIIRIEKVRGNEAPFYGLPSMSSDFYIGILAWGYGDGFNRRLAGKGEVLLKGKRYPLIREIGLNHSMVYLGDNFPIQVNNNAIIIGAREGSPGIDEMAEICGTIPQEILCNIRRDHLRSYVSIEI